MTTTPPTANTATQLLSALDELRNPTSLKNTQGAAKEICKAIVSGSIPETLVDAGLVEAVVNAMKRDGYAPRFYVRLCWILSDCMDGGEGSTYVDQALENGALQAVIDLMERFSTSEDMQAAALGLFNIFSEKSTIQTKKDIVTTIVENTIKVMENYKDSPAIFSVACDVMHTAFEARGYGMEDEKLVEKFEGLISYGMSKYSSDAIIQESGGFLLLCLTALPHLVSQIEKIRSPSCDESEMQTALEEIMDAVSAGLSQPLVNAGVIETVVGAMKKEGHTSEAYQLLCGVLARLMSRDNGKAYAKQILDEGGLEGMFCIADRLATDEMVQRAMMGLFLCCLKRVDTSRGQEIAPAMIQRILQTMANHKRSLNLFSPCCRALYQALDVLDFSLGDDTKLFDECVNCILCVVSQRCREEGAAEMGRLLLEGLVGSDVAKDMISDIIQGHLLSQLGVLRNPSRDAVEALKAAKVLSSAVSEKNEKFTLALVDAGLFDTIISAINESRLTPGFLCALCSILVACMYQSEAREKYTDEILQKGGLESTVALMRLFPSSERVQIAAIEMLYCFASKKHADIAPTILEHTVNATESVKDSAHLYSTACLVLENALKSIGWCVEDEELFHRVVKCVWDGVSRHPHDEEAQETGRAMLHCLVDGETAGEMIAKSERLQRANAA